jgi:hypothetical protein
MTTKNFKNLGANPVQVTLAPGEFNNTLQTNIPRQKLPFDFSIASIPKDSTLQRTDPGYPISFPQTDQTFLNNLITIVQKPADGGIQAHTEIHLKAGHVYKLTCLVLASGFVSGEYYGFFYKKDIIPTPDYTKIIGKQGITSASGTQGFNAPTIGFLDLRDSNEDAIIVLAFLDGTLGGNRSLDNSYLELETVTNLSGPWN